MKIAVPYENGQVAQSLAACRQFLIVTAKNGDPTAKELARSEERRVGKECYS